MNETIDEMIYQALDDFKALTLDELHNLLRNNFLKDDDQHCTMEPWLNLLKIEQKIHSVKIRRGNPLSKYKFFREYAGKHLYYIDNKHLMDWIIMQTPPPDKTSEKFQIALKKKARKYFGIELEQP